MILTMKRRMVRATCVLPQSTPGTPNWILIIEYYGTKKKQLPNAFCSQKRSDNHHECGNQNWERSNKTLEIIPIRTQPKKQKKNNLKPNLKFWKHKLRRLKWETSVIVVVGVTVLLGLLRASSLTERFERRGKVWRRGIRFSRPKLLWCYASNSNLNIHLQILGFNSAAALIWNLRATINIPLLSVTAVGQHHSPFPPNEI